MNNARKYWIQFLQISPEGATMEPGEIEHARDTPICGIADLQQISQGIAVTLFRAGKITAETQIRVVGWQAFESPLLIVARH